MLLFITVITNYLTTKKTKNKNVYRISVPVIGFRKAGEVNTLDCLLSAMFQSQTLFMLSLHQKV